MSNHVTHVNTGVSIYQKGLEERRLLQWELSRGADTTVKWLDCDDEQKQCKGSIIKKKISMDA